LELSVWTIGKRFIVSGILEAESGLEAGAGPRRYPLRSELALSCLPQGRHEPGRHLIWINTLCALVLLVGLLGWQRPLSRLHLSSSLDEVQTLPVLFTPPPESARAPSDTAPDPDVVPQAADFVEVPSVPTPVAPLSADVAFAVPIEGPTIEVQSVALAEPPPSAPVPVAASDVTGPQVFRPGQGAPDGGFYPDPEYPRDALLRREQGQTQILIEVGADGRVERTEIRISSGFTSLDRHTLSHVRRFWRFPPGQRREYLWTAEYVLR